MTKFISEKKILLIFGLIVCAFMFGGNEYGKKFLGALLLWGFWLWHDWHNIKNIAESDDLYDEEK